MAPPRWSYLWDGCVGVYGTFHNIPTVESYGAGVFVPAGTVLAVKLLRFNYFKKTHMIKLSLQMSHITSLPIQISHVKYVVHQTQAIGLTSPPPQHHHIVQAIPISPSPPSPTSALPCVVFGFFQQS